MAKKRNPAEETDSDLLIDMQDIVKTFNIGTPNELTILHGVNFNLARGEFLSVVGTSGSGKSTLMNIIGLLDKPTSGTYNLDGVDVLELSDDKAALYRSKHIGFVFQNFNLIGRISARRNVELPMMYAGVDRKDRTERANHLLEMVGMQERADHLPAELSGGQKQRVAIARALSNSPDLMLADEPTGALDTATGRMVMDLFHDLNQNHGVTIALITHNPELAEETTRIVTMNDGILTGPPAPQNGIVPAVMLAPATGPFTAITPDDIAAAEAKAAAASQSPTNATPAASTPAAGASSPTPAPKPAASGKPTVSTKPKVPAKPKVKKAKSKSQRHSTTAQGQSGEAWRGVTTGTGTGVTWPRFGQSGGSASDSKATPGGDD